MRSLSPRKKEGTVLHPRLLREKNCLELVVWDHLCSRKRALRQRFWGGNTWNFVVWDNNLTVEKVCCTHVFGGKKLLGISVESLPPRKKGYCTAPTFMGKKNYLELVLDHLCSGKSVPHPIFVLGIHVGLIFQWKKATALKFLSGFFLGITVV